MLIILILEGVFKQFKILFENITLVDIEDFIDKLEEGKEIMASIDIEDVPFIALALSIGNDGIWSDDKHFNSRKKLKSGKQKTSLKCWENQANRKI